jgi:m7GpppX diphosphatase
MASAASSTSSGVLDGFKLIRILDQDPKHKSANLLGEFTSTAQDGSTSVDQAVLILEKTHFSEQFYSRLEAPTRASTSGGERTTKAPKLDADAAVLDGAERDAVYAAVSDLGQNDVYTWLLAR